jgi:hypothetical protein
VEAEVNVEVPAAADTPTEGEDAEKEDVIEPVQENGVVEVVDDSSPEEAPVPIDAPVVEESPIVNEGDNDDGKGDQEEEEENAPKTGASTGTNSGNGLKSSVLILTVSAFLVLLQ